ncbi:MAG TPA: DUF2339 domain-containing protein, partial [Vicinamibacterales bacterium]|nr:DUF2339 domain-containing protein [Vicinamibacterales bacterium]
EAAWSATNLTADHLRDGIVIYAAFAAFYLGGPLVARRLDRDLRPAWGGGAVLIAGLLLLLFLAAGPQTPAALWGLAVLLALLNAGVFVESASGGLPALALVGGALSWIVLGVWWVQSAAVVGVIPSLFVLVMLTLIMLGGHAWAHVQAERAGESTGAAGFRHGAFLGLIGHLFLFALALQPDWATPPWPLFGALAVITLAVSAASLAIGRGPLHAAGAIAAAAVVLAWSSSAPLQTYEWAALAAAEAVAAYALAWIAAFVQTNRDSKPSAAAAIAVLFIACFVVASAAALKTAPSFAILIATYVVNLSIVLWLAWQNEWPVAGVLSVAVGWLVTLHWQTTHEAAVWPEGFALAAALYAVYTAYPFVLGSRAEHSRSPFLVAVAGSAFFFFTARTALLQGGLGGYLGAVPVGEGLVMALLLRRLLALQPAEDDRDLGRLAVVAGAALAFATVAIPLQLHHQWITIGWALEGAALAWAYRRIPHRGLFFWSLALLAAVFVRLILNPSVFFYEPRGMRIFNWYLYTYLTGGVSMIASAYFFKDSDDSLGPTRALAFTAAAGVIVLFWVLNIEIADYYATGAEFTFRFGVTLAQDLTYTIGWLIFGMLLLTAGIYLRLRPARVAAVALIAVTALKGFLYDMRSLGGLYRVGSLVGLAISLSLVALALQKFVLHRGEEE